MDLQDLANIIQGNIPTRIEVSSGQPIETITMQELNYIANVNLKTILLQKKKM